MQGGTRRSKHLALRLAQVSLAPYPAPQIGSFRMDRIVGDDLGPVGPDRCGRVFECSPVMADSPEILTLARRR